MIKAKREFKYFRTPTIQPEKAKELIASLISGCTVGWGLDLSLSDCNLKKKIKNTTRTKKITLKNLKYRKCKSGETQKRTRLPLIAVNERVCSPTNMSDFRARNISPVTNRSFRRDKIKFSQLEIDNQYENYVNKYMIQCTEEQDLINKRVRMKVIEAKMSRYAGFKSPRVLLNKLINNPINNTNFDITEQTQEQEFPNVIENSGKIKNMKFNCEYLKDLSL